MHDVLVLRLDAPLMSFGGVVVDNLGVTRDFPAQSMLTGLLGNALGYDHADAGLLERLQARLRFGVRCDRRGQRVEDYQTVDLGQSFLVDTGWTTRGRVEGRAGASSTETHIRKRAYLADAVYTVALRLDPEGEAPDVSALERALREPERPIFLGRKPCLPAAPLIVGRVAGASLLDVLEGFPAVAGGRADCGPHAVWWPASEEGRPGSREVPITDERDWENQIHVGRRYVYEGWINMGGGAS